MSKSFSCLKCFDTGYITLVKKHNEIPYDYFFACSCVIGTGKVFNPCGKAFKTGQPMEAHIRDYRGALHQGYRLHENFLHVGSIDGGGGTVKVQRGCPVDN